MNPPHIFLGAGDEDAEVVLHGLEDIFPRVLPISRTLHTVRLSNCFLRTIPEEFSTLVNLEHIYLDHNKIKVLPENFHNLTKVKTLHLHYNRICTAPLPIEGLLELDMFSNRLSSVPDIGLTTPLFDMAQNYMLYTVYDPIMAEKAQALRDKYGYVDRFDSRFVKFTIICSHFVPHTAMKKVYEIIHLIFSKPNAPTRFHLMFHDFRESDTESEEESAEGPAQEIIGKYLITRARNSYDKAGVYYFPTSSMKLKYSVPIISPFSIIYISTDPTMPPQFLLLRLDFDSLKLALDVKDNSFQHL